MSSKLNEVPRQDANNRRFRGLILSGRAGIGKTTSLMEMVSPEEKFVRIPMASRTAEDFGVYPVPDKQKVTGLDGTERDVWTIAQPLIEAQIVPLLKENIGSGYGVLLLDDVTLADPRLQSGLLELVQFGRIGDFEIGENVLVAMTGNGIEDGCSAVEWNKALLGRSMLINYEPDFDAWIDYPCNRDLDPSVIGFLKENGGFFAPSAGNTQYSDENGKTPSPRDHTALGTELSQKHGGVRNFKPGFLWKSPTQLAESMSGKQFATAYGQFISLLMEYPTSEELMEDPTRWDRLDAAKKNNIGCVFAVGHALRSNFIRFANKLEETHAGKPKDLDSAREKLVKNVLHATASMAQSRREMAAFIFRHIVSELQTKNEGRNDKTRDTCVTKLSAWVYRLDGKQDDHIDSLELDKVFESIRTMGQV
ncbi:hypothetical protein IFT48_04135 [Pseudomonas fluorescens]|uniref:ATP-binding protein n=1 Tax=Pseudomonas fluorescens TaxID=294 RepID=UPI001930BDBF|nr:hypothetical protein [Pseudomonas fluorescens]MBD8089161.1 hypothetical protein [Pseudomonas fluorescens]